MKFIEKDVSVDQTAAAEFQALGFRGVPSFKIDDVTFSGLDINRVLGEIDYRLINCPECQKKLRVPKDVTKLKVSCPACQHSFTVTN